MTRPPTSEADAMLLPLQRQAARPTDNGALSLTTFGLSADADAVWHELVRWPDVAHHDMCTRVCIDGKRVNEALEELLERGFVEPAATTLGVAAVDPMIAIEHAVSVRQRDLAAQLSQLSDLRAHLPLLAQQYARGRQRVDQELPIEVVYGIDATRARLVLSARSARVETLNMDCGTSAKGMDASRPDDLALLERGIISRTIIERAVLDDEELFRDWAVLAAAGEQIRVVDRLPARIAIHDNAVAVLPLDAEDLYRGAIFIRIRTIIDTYVYLFERLWNEATPLFGLIESADAPSGRSARVLQLMAAGRKDEAIARCLGVGVRTIRRDIAVLMGQLGEHTRAATVAAAIRRGWLSA
jgi:DNA-binding CsgD family transcriptional regulator